jgi:hypothetical protein
MTWEPIATAPRTGEMIDLWVHWREADDEDLPRRIPDCYWGLLENRKDYGWVDPDGEWGEPMDIEERFIPMLWMRFDPPEST